MSNMEARAVMQMTTFRLAKVGGFLRYFCWSFAQNILCCVMLVLRDMM